MLKVLSPGIILTSSKEVVDRLFTGKPMQVTEASRLISEIDQENSIIINQSSSKNLIEFEFNFNSSNKSEYGVTLSFLDVDNNFVQQYVDSNVNLILLKKIQETIESRKKINDFDISKIYVNEIINPKLTYHTIYFAFGNGDDIQKWGGPFRMNLKGFNITNFEGLNKITLEFASLGGPIKTSTVHRGAQKSLEESVISNWRFLKKDLIAGLQVQTEVQQKDLLPYPENKENFDSIFFNLLKRYITGITGIPAENIVLLLPSLHSIYQEIYNLDTTKKFKEPIIKGLSPAFLSLSFNIFLEPIQQFLATIGFDLIPKSKLLPPEQFRENELSQGFIVQFGKISDKLELVDFYEPLDSFFEKLTSVISKYKVNYPQSNFDFSLAGFSLIEEVDYGFLNILNKFKIIKDPTKNALFVGDSNVISKLVYCNDVISLSQSLELPNKIGYSFYDEKNIKLSNSSDFKEAVDTSDEFDYSKIIKDVAEIEGIPVFKYNLPNSNVLSLNIDYNNKLLDFLNYNVVQKERYGSIRSITTLLAERFKTLLPIDQLLSGYDPINISEIPFKELVDVISITLSEFFSSENVKTYLKKFLDDDNTVKFHQFTVQEVATIIATDYYWKANKDTPKIYVDSSVINNKMELFDQINRRAISVSIKTLPFFNMNKTAVNGKKCLLLFNRNTTFGQSANQSIIKFSGVYRIIGFSHVITPNDSYSTFDLIIDNSVANVVDESNRKTILSLINDYYKLNPINTSQPAGLLPQPGESLTESIIKETLYPYARDWVKLLKNIF
jgi:hypothetical protein